MAKSGPTHRLMTCNKLEVSSSALTLCTSFIVAKLKLHCKRITKACFYNDIASAITPQSWFCGVLCVTV